MEYLNKLLVCVEKYPTIFRKSNLNFIVGLTNTHMLKTLKNTQLQMN